MKVVFNSVENRNGFLQKIEELALKMYDGGNDSLLDRLDDFAPEQNWITIASNYP